MQLRYTAKIYNLNKVLSQVNITRPHFSLLFTIYSLNQATTTKIFKELLLAHYGQAPAKLTQHLKELLSSNLITRTGYIYNITPQGLLCLQDIEKRIRKS